jgi:hypothetical protein
VFGVNEAFRLGILKLQNRIHLFINFICSADTAHSPASPMSTGIRPTISSPAAQQSLADLDIWL